MKLGKAIRDATARWRGGLTRQWLIAVASVGLFGACRDEARHPVVVAGEPVDSVALRQAFKGLFKYGAALNIKVTGFGDSISYWASSVHCFVNCEGFAPNTADIFVELPRKGSLIEVRSQGPYICSGVLPTITAFDNTGQQLDTETMQIFDPPDCAAGNDDMSNRLIGGLSDPNGKIARIRITPPAPWQWQITTSTGEVLPARARIDHTVAILGLAPVPPVPDSLCPPTGDPVFDSLNVRQAAFAIFDSSGAMTVPPWERREYAFTVHRNQDGSFRIVFPPQVNEQCQVRVLAPPSFFFGDSTLVAFFHVHPAEAGEVVTCPSGDRLQYDPVPFNGLSGGEGDMLQFTLMLAARLGMTPRGIGMYVIDREKVWLNPPFSPTLPGNYFDQGRSVPRRPSSCKWL